MFRARKRLSPQHLAAKSEPYTWQGGCTLKVVVAEFVSGTPVRGSSTEERGFCEEDQTRWVAFIDRIVCVRTDEAERLIRRWLDAEIETAQLRQKYTPIFRKVPGKQAATFFQLDRRISMPIDVQLTSRLPLTQSQD